MSLNKELLEYWIKEEIAEIKPDGVWGWTKEFREWTEPIVLTCLSECLYGHKSTNVSVRKDTEYFLDEGGFTPEGRRK